jgi:hypothetical protein
MNHPELAVVTQLVTQSMKKAMSIDQTWPLSWWAILGLNQ